MGYSDSGTAIAFIVIGSLVSAALALSLLWYFLRLWIRGPTLGSDNKRTLRGATVAITGGNSGIGKATALDLAKRGARVLLLCRSPEKAGRAAADITSQVEANAVSSSSSDNKAESSGQIVVYRLDLASLTSVREATAALLKSESRLDVLINNAGTKMSPKGAKTQDGFDMQFGVNYLGHYLLTQLLMPLIKKTEEAGGRPRIINVSSRAHHFGVIHWKDVNFYKSYDAYKAYAQSKLALVMHTKELSRRLAGSNIRAFSVNPGETDTALHRRRPARWKCWDARTWCTWVAPLIYAIRIHSPFVKSAEYGAQTLIFAAIDGNLDAEDASGRYFKECREARPSARAMVVKDCLKLWDLSHHYCNMALSKQNTPVKASQHTPAMVLTPPTPTTHYETTPMKNLNVSTNSKSHLLNTSTQSEVL